MKSPTSTMMMMMLLLALLGIMLALPTTNALPTPWESFINPKHDKYTTTEFIKLTNSGSTTRLNTFTFEISNQNDVAPHFSTCGIQIDVVEISSVSYHAIEVDDIIPVDTPGLQTVTFTLPAPDSIVLFHDIIRVTITCQIDFIPPDFDTMLKSFGRVTLKYTPSMGSSQLEYHSDFDIYTVDDDGDGYQIQSWIEDRPGSVFSSNDIVNTSVLISSSQRIKAPIGKIQLTASNEWGLYLYTNVDYSDYICEINGVIIQKNAITASFVPYKLPTTRDMYYTRQITIQLTKTQSDIIFNYDHPSPLSFNCDYIRLITPDDLHMSVPMTNGINFQMTLFDLNNDKPVVHRYLHSLIGRAPDLPSHFVTNTYFNNTLGGYQTYFRQIGDTFSSFNYDAKTQLTQMGKNCECNHKCTDSLQQSTLPQLDPVDLNHAVQVKRDYLRWGNKGIPEPFSITTQSYKLVDEGDNIVQSTLELNDIYRTTPDIDNYPTMVMTNNLLFCTPVDQTLPSPIITSFSHPNTQHGDSSVKLNSGKFFVRGQHTFDQSVNSVDFGFGIGDDTHLNIAFTLYAYKAIGGSHNVDKDQITIKVFSADQMLSFTNVTTCNLYTNGDDFIEKLSPTRLHYNSHDDANFAGFDDRSRFRLNGFTFKVNKKNLISYDTTPPTPGIDLVDLRIECQWLHTPPKHYWNRSSWEAASQHLAIETLQEQTQANSSVNLIKPYHKSIRKSIVQVNAPINPADSTSPDWNKWLLIILLIILSPLIIIGIVIILCCCGCCCAVAAVTSPTTPLTPHGTYGHQSYTISTSQYPTQGGQYQGGQYATGYQQQPQGYQQQPQGYQQQPQGYQPPQAPNTN